MAKTFDLKTDFLARAKQQKDNTEDEIRKKITFDPVLKGFIRPLNETESQQLEDNILKEGCKDPIILWKKPETDDYIIVDGHNRHRICSKHGLTFPFTIREFGNIEEVKEFMINNQLGRRNLTPAEMHYFIGLKYINEKQIGFKTKAEEAPTAKKIAQEHQINERTVERNANYAKGLDMVDLDLKSKILSGAVKIKKGDLEWLGAHASGSKNLGLKDVRDMLANKTKTQKLIDELRKKEENDFAEPTRVEAKEMVQPLLADELNTDDIEQIVADLKKAVKNQDHTLFKKALANLEHLEEMLFEI